MNCQNVVEEEDSREEDGTFPLMLLSDDLIANVLSFVSSIPFENLDDDLLQKHVASNLRDSMEKSKSSSRCIGSFGSLTHVLPLVCHKFRRICNNSDVLWKGSMLRLMTPKISNQSLNIWREGLVTCALSDLEQLEDDADGFGIENLSYLMDKATSVISQEKKRSHAAMTLCQEIVKEYRPFVWAGPIFFLVSDHDQGMDEDMNLHLFEKRYQLMMSELMENKPQCDKDGNLIPLCRRPRFFFSSGLSTPLRAGDPVAVVEVTHCEMKEDGRAMVTVVPVGQKTLISTKARPESFNLVDATVTTTQRIRNKTFMGPVFLANTYYTAPSRLYSVFRMALVEECYIRMLRDTKLHEDVGRNPRFVLAASVSHTPQPAAVVELLRIRVDSDNYAGIELMIIAKGIIQHEPVAHPTIPGLFLANLEIDPIQP